MGELGGLGFPILRNPPLFDRPLLVFGVALLGSRYQRGVDDLAAHRDVARRAQRHIELREQRLDRLRLRQLLSEQPNRARVGNAVGEAEPKKPHERQAVVDQELRALVGEIVGALNDQHLEHHHRIERRSPALRSVRIGQRLHQFRPERLEIDDLGEGQQLIAEIRQPLQSLVDVEEPWLPAHRFVSRSAEHKESEIAPNSEVFRSVQLERQCLFAGEAILEMLP